MICKQYHIEKLRYTPPQTFIYTLCIPTVMMLLIACSHIQLLASVHPCMDLIVWYNIICIQRSRYVYEIIHMDKHMYVGLFTCNKYP